MTSHYDCPPINVSAEFSQESAASAARPIRSSEAAADVELLRRCRAGDSAAWAILVNRYESLVFAVARRNGLSTEDAADACQATFEALITSIDSVHTVDRLPSWLMTVARRTAWKMNGPARREQPLATMPEAADDPQREWEQTVSIHEALAAIGQPCRDLLLALYFDPQQPSYAELAQRFGRSIGGIGPLRGRCLQRLRSLMEEAAE